MSYNSKYKGTDVEEALDRFADGKVGNIGAVDTNDSVDELDIEYVTKVQLDNAIAQAITITLNTEV